MSQIRVCSITFDWYPFDIRVRRLAEAATRAGFLMDVICLSQPGAKRREICNGVSIYRLPMGRSYGGTLLATIQGWCCFLILAGFAISCLHLKRRYDVIHVHNMPDFLVFSAFLPKLLGARVILDVQDVSPELMGAKTKGLLKKLFVPLAVLQERISTAFADHVVTVGWPFEKLLLKRGVRPEKLTNILNSADPQLFPIERRSDAPSFSKDEQMPFILMYHGTVAQRNGLDTAVRAFALARQVIPNLRFDIQGRGEMLSAIKQLATKLGVREHMVFTESSPSDKIVDFVVHGDIGIIPYQIDGFADLVLPTKAYEFAWMYRPIIASNTPAIRSMFRPESIILCDPMVPEDFANAIIDLYKHPEKRLNMVNHAAEDYRPFQWEKMAERYAQLLIALSRKRTRSVITTSLRRSQAERLRI